MVDEMEVCILCGKELKGTPAAADYPIRIMRKIRELLKSKPIRTVACGKCFADCVKKREGFEKKRKRYLGYGIAFSAMIIVGGLFFGNMNLQAIAAGFAGGCIIFLLSYLDYWPKFGTAPGNASNSPNSAPLS